ncbi:bifunctional copper resistance protein CopD/cytochrome c oxidase assembly protein [Aeromicrobium duanguangcaii]|uniref:Bifunctional copper resistance protein CopD/cytochrome c oxidase assembly protein n=1 Tax=Aeromicrobium duanguangcaii TaxID=2968086 RepID=A0ABY5KFH1_9ACTN|nr:bifunctional copper resistance protein CopD/cytochrome c oxidase assembly protein [Aeromicrobium duanguangcaii]MCD9152873.1 bifunctional copper resistance protein CopD/cytochrome c oxidase assembly protein [Aeromicrobium duanguangcaii]UUI67148.1 bifunctional copper resistance protein CopD/cytochrome c oxidase assembly protein [Aeromicrobium duanguangcaii]
MSVPERTARPGVAGLGLAALVGVGLIAVVGLIVGTGATPEPPPAGLPDPGPFVAWALPISRFLSHLLATVTVGFLLVAVVLLPSGDHLEGLAVQAVRIASRAAWGWLAAVALFYWANVADLYARPLTKVGLGQLVDYASVFATGRGLLVQAVAALVVALWAHWTFSVRQLAICVPIAVVGVAAVGMTGHSASAGSHMLATTSLVLHLVGVVVWVGGLIALAWVALRHSRRLDDAVARYSTLAAWCFAIVAISGVISASVNLGSFGGIDSTYGALVVVKAIALVGLGAFGIAQRRRLRLKSAGFTRFAVSEAVLMTLTMAVAVVLGRTATPVGEDVLTSPAELLLGRELPPEPTLGRVLVGFYPDGIGLAVVGLGTALYVTGLIMMRRRNDRWPVGRTISWFFGLAIVGWATFGGLGAYSSVTFSLHMVSHMMLSMIAPIFLVLGAPMTLALRTLPGPRRPGEHSPRSLLRDALQSPVSKFYTNPIVAAVIFLGTLYAVYYTGLFESMMRTHSGHAFMELHFLISGFLFYYVIIGIDPSPKRLSPLSRFGVLMLSVPFHAFFSVALMSSSVVIAESYYKALDRPYATDLAQDQYLGGGIAWAMGEVPLLLVIGAIFIQWFRSDSREATRGDRAADRDEDAALAKYNAYLARLEDDSPANR